MTRDEEAAALGAVPLDRASGYYIARDGSVYSSRRLRADRPLKKMRRGSNGDYPVHGLMVNGKVHTFLLHILVAETFLPPRPSDDHNVRHENGDTNDARADNLLWGTQLQNIHDKWRHGTMATGDRNGLRVHPESVRRGERSASAKLTEAQVTEIRRRLRDGELGYRLADEFGVLKTTISAIKTRRTWTHLEDSP